MKDFNSLLCAVTPAAVFDNTFLKREGSQKPRVLSLAISWILRPTECVARGRAGAMALARMGAFAVRSG